MRGLLRKLWEHPGLLVLVVLLLSITAGTIKPDFYLLGWDNFSSYLNLPTSLQNTLFATWREHRGLGVPSDAEINDLFRQLISFALSFVFSKQLLDQIYIVFMFWGGVLGMYHLGRYISKYINEPTHNQEVFATSAALFYLFNLSTLAVFYFPMIMYITRFFMLPTTTYVLLRFIHERRLTKRFYLFAILILFVGFGAFMVPTIYIVTMLAYGLMLLFVKNWKRVILVFTFFTFLGAYWILPFINYTIQKGPIVPKAPLFVIINEAMLTKPASYYSFARQAKLRPSFFSETTFTNNALSARQPLHPLAGYDEKGVTAVLLWIFPFLYIIGMGYIVVFNRNRILLWFVAITTIFLTLSMKEYSSLGFFYSFLSDHIPFTNTIFRFGDTKFHAMIAFGGAIVASAFITQVYQWVIQINLRRRLTQLILCTLLGAGVILLGYPFKNYFSGNFIGYFMYNRIPQAYFDIADIINKDPDPIRVVHFPFDRYSYWKPYAWGYFGSSFLHFMLNKPLFDRAFEPASEENAQIHQQMMDLIYLASMIPSNVLLKDRAMQLNELFKSTSVRYIIDDGTVSTNAVARNISYWGTIDPTSSQRLLEYLLKNGYVQLVKEYAVIPADNAPYYAKLYPYNTKIADYAYTPRVIRLYRIINTAARVQLINEADVIHTVHDTMLSPAIKTTLSPNYIQSPRYDDSAILYPFILKPDTANTTDDNLRIKIPAKLKPGTFTIENEDISDNLQTHLINVSLEYNNPKIRVAIEYPVYPTIENAVSPSPKPYSTIEFQDRRNDYSHLRIGDSVFPIQPTTNTSPKFIGSVLLENNDFPISLLFPSASYDISSNLLQWEPHPQCLSDQLENSASSITGDNGILTIVGQNVSSCLTTEVNLTSANKTKESAVTFAQLEFDVQGKSQSLSEKKQIDSWKPKLAQYVQNLDNPLIIHVCIKPNGSVKCINSQNLIRVKKDTTHFTLPITSHLTSYEKLHITFTIRSSQPQTYETEITNIRLKTFTSDQSTHLSLAQPTRYMNTYKITQNRDLELSIPVGTSDTNQKISLPDDGILIGRDSNCDQINKDQSTKESSSGLLLYSVGCKSIINRNIPFSSFHYYFWQVVYKHLSGAFPTLSLTDKVSTYMYNKLIPKEKNPDNYFSTSLQNPETVLSSEISIAQKILTTPTSMAYGYVDPRPELLDGGNKEFILEHFSQNEGLSLIESISLVQLPTFLLNSKFYPSEYQRLQFDTKSSITSYTSYLPSLKQITITAQQEGQALLLFNEQFDKQWILWNVPLVLHVRCNSYANCFIFKLPQGSTSAYLFYLPEILNFVGFGVTVLAIIFGYYYFIKSSKHYHLTNPG